ncbi:MAG: hypothetical protein ACLGIN_10010 [Candidatus Sericytochromatia bacterium]
MRPLLALATALLLLGGCANQPLFGNQWNQPNLGTAPLPTSEPTLVGRLVSVASGVGGGTLVIQPETGEATSIQLNARTVMMRQDGNRVSFTAFEAGQTLRVWLGDEGPETVMIVQ